MRHRCTQSDEFINLGVFGEYPDALWVMWSKKAQQIKWRSLYNPQAKYETCAIQATTQVEARTEVQKLIVQRDEAKQRQLVLM